MDELDAVALISDLVSAEVESMKELYNRRKITKATLRWERKAARALFAALTGHRPTNEQLEDMVNP